MASSRGFTKPRRHYHPIKTSVAVIGIFVLISLIFTTHPSHPLRPFNRANPYPNDLCNVIGTNPDADDLWQFNTRSNCLSSHICFSEAHILHTANLSKTECRVLTSQLSDAGRTFPTLLRGQKHSCQWFQQNLVHCAHGKNLRYNTEHYCPKVEHIERHGIRWVEDISIVLADYPYPWNIYHFASIAWDLHRTVEQLPTYLEQWGWENVHASDGSVLKEVRKVNVILQIPKKVEWKNMRWQEELLQIAHDHISKKVPVRFQYVEEVDRVCLRNAVVMGRRGHSHMWPFINDSIVHVDGVSTPKDAVDFRRFVYEAFDVPSRLPGGNVSELPPFVVGYSRREPYKHEGYYRWGASRRLRDEDEKWFVSMLENETRAAGAEFVTMSFNSDQNLKEQVESIQKVGFLVGIHGANLVNAIFMHPYSAIMELMPNGALIQCYLGGLNSGLKYLRFESSEYSTVEESECDPEDTACSDINENRLVKLGKVSDRNRARQMFRDGLEHVKMLRERFPEGIPVKYNEQTAHYDIEGLEEVPQSVAEDA